MLGTRNIVEGCKRRGVPKLIYTSSPSVVFDMKDECGINEKTPYSKRFYNIYSKTKALAEKMVLNSSGRDGILTCALRPHLIWGPRDNHLLPRLIQRAQSQENFGSSVTARTRSISRTSTTRPIAHLMACDAISIKRVSGEAYFISDGQPVALWKWINEFLEAVGVPPVKKRVSARMAYAAGAQF